MRVSSLFLSLALLAPAGPLRAAMIVRAPVMTPKPLTSPSFVIRTRRDLNVLVTGLGKLSPEAERRLTTAGQELLLSGTMLAVPLKSQGEVYFLTKNGQGQGAVVSLEKDGAVTQGYVFYRLSTTLKKTQGERAAADVAGDFDVMGRIFDGTARRPGDTLGYVGEPIEFSGGAIVNAQELINQRSEIRVWNKTDARIGRVAVPAKYYTYQFLDQVLPDGRFLVKLNPHYSKASRFAALDPATRRMKIYGGNAGAIDPGGALLTPKGNSLLQVESKGLLLTDKFFLVDYTVSTGKTRRVRVKDTLSYLSINAVSPDGRFVLGMEGPTPADTNLVIIDLRTGRVLGKRAVPALKDLAFSRGGAQVVYHDKNGSRRVWNWR